MEEQKAKGLNGIKYKWLIAAGGILGVALILLGGSGLLSHKKSTEPSASAPDTEAVSSYTAILEKKVTSLVSEVCGGNPAVLITLDCSEEAVYAGNTRESASYEGETVSAASSEREYLILSQNGEDGGLLLREIYPKIRGIAVVCAGGESATVQLEVIRLLSVAFGVPASRVCVSGSG